MRSLKSYILIINAALLTLLFIVVFLVSTYMHTSLAEQNAIKHSDAVSRQIFASMYQVMKRGWSREELNTFMESLKTSFDGSNYVINVYRGEKVKQLFGTVQEAPRDALVRQVLQDGIKATDSQEGRLRHLTPITARQACLQCHANADIGDTLGVIDVRQDLIDVIEETFLDYVIFFLLMIPLFVLAVFGVTHYTTRRITASLNRFARRVDNINSITDFKAFDSSDIDLRFREFNALARSVTDLADKLKEIAVDKELLKFEIQLLDKLIITSEVVKDWREHVGELHHDINQIMPTHTLMTIFRIGDDLFEVDIFWHGIPKESMKATFEAYVCGEIEANPHLGGSVDYVIKHNFSDTSYCINENNLENMSHRTKSLFLDSPKIGGIVGLSLQTEVLSDPVRHIVVDSILTTLANLVGSIKAINKYTQDLEFYAAHDPLTSLFNQRVFNDLLEYEVKRARRHDYTFGLIMIDCDNFKLINDHYGHAFGDKYLQAFADLLEQHKRDEDILARYGGDEFTLILPEADLESVEAIAAQIENAAKAFKLRTPEGGHVTVTLSIGIAVYPLHATGEKELFVIADSMMYKAKQEGKDAIRIPTDDDVMEALRTQKSKAAALMNAIAVGSIIPYFQPICACATREMTIHEVLMRVEIDGRIMTAGEFVDIAESMNLINKMDMLVIENAFKKMKAEQYDHQLFINLSPKSLVVGNFVEAITRLVHRYGIDKSCIVFEITERETVKNFTILEQFVANLKLEGYKFAIDDFGSGFSSFHYIKKFPIDFLKIDGEFIASINHNRKDRAFVQSILTLAQELEILTIAEFVEDEAIACTLREMGVDFLQGYYIGRPAPDFSRKRAPAVC